MLNGKIHDLLGVKCCKITDVMDEDGSN